ncbi:unnamed protein product, partial [marine sediment metagenome]
VEDIEDIEGKTVHLCSQKSSAGDKILLDQETFLS